MIKAIIVDDEQNSRSALKSMLLPFSTLLTVVGEASDGKAALALVRKTMPDLVFLDISLKGHTAFDFLEQLPRVDFKIVFVTGYETYAIKAIKYNAFDYLLKPVDPDELEKVVLKAKTAINEFQLTKRLDQLSSFANVHKRIAVNTQDGMELIETHNIVWLHAESAYTKVYLNDKTSLLFSKNLKYFEELLDTTLFYRVHHSVIININHMRKYRKEDGGTIVMSDGSTVPVASRRKIDFMERITKQL